MPKSSLKTDPKAYMINCLEQCQRSMSACIQALRQCEACGTQDEVHQACAAALRMCITSCAICAHDCSWYSDATAAQCVESCRRCALDCAACAAACKACAAACPDCRDACRECEDCCADCQELCQENAGVQPAVMAVAGAAPGGQVPTSGLPWVRVRNSAAAAGQTEILIYGMIGGEDDEGASTAQLFAEQLKQATGPIVVGIHSPGGNLWDGLAIYNLLLPIRDRVITRVDGLAASSAAVIAMAGKECHMAKDALLMIHNSSAMCMGTADDMEKMGEMLHKHDDVLAGIFAGKSKLAETKVRGLLDAETWYTGPEALAAGLVDKLIETPSIQNRFDLSRFRRVPAGVEGSTPKIQNLMNKKEIIALLRNKGIQVADDATTETVLALLGQMTNQLPQAPAAAAPAQPGQAQPAAGSTAAELAEVKALLKTLTEARDHEQKTRVETAVQNAIDEFRIPADQKAKWVARAMKDETVLDDLKALQPAQPGTSPLGAGIIEVGADVKNVDKEVQRICKEMTLCASGQVTGVKPPSGTQLFNTVKAVREKIIGVWNTNTISADLQRVTILSGAALTAFKRRLAAIQVFCTRFVNVPLEGTNEIPVPYYPLNANAVQTWNAANGYNTFGNTNTDSRKITVNQRKWLGIAWTSDELRRQPFLDMEKQTALLLDNLGYETFKAIHANITIANFGEKVMASDAVAFDYDDTQDLKDICDKANWPIPARSLVLDSTHANYLARDSRTHLLSSGSNVSITKGEAPDVSGFGVPYSVPNLPNNNEKLAGYAVFPSALLVAICPIQPTEDVRRLLSQYLVITDPDTGLSFEYRRGGNTTLDRSEQIVECNYGVAKGEGNALKRIEVA